MQRDEAVDAARRLELRRRLDEAARRERAEGGLRELRGGRLARGERRAEAAVEDDLGRALSNGSGAGG